MGGERTNQEAKCLQPLSSVARASLSDQGSEVLPAQHLLAGLRYIYICLGIDYFVDVVVV